MKERDASQFNPENYELPLKRHVYCKILFNEVFLPVLKECFPVYWKWLHWQAQSLPKWMDIIEPSLKKLESANNHQTPGEIIQAICQSIREILYKMVEFHGQSRDCPANRIDAGEGVDSGKNLICMYGN